MKIQKSNPISAFGGMNFVFEYLQKNNLDSLFNDQLPSLAQQSEYGWSEIMNSLLCIYLCGGDCIEDLQTHLKSHFQNNPFINLPSSDTVLRRLKQLSVNSTSCQTKRGSVVHTYNSNPLLCQLNIEVLKKMGVFNAKELVLDYDNTILFNEKSDSKMTYKRNPGYQPGVCTINEEHILYVENRNGNSDAKSFQAETLDRLFNLLNSNGIRKADHFRADAASYQYDVVELLEQNVNYFYIGGRNSYVSKYFNQISQWNKITENDNEEMEVGEILIRPFQKQSKDESRQPKQYRLIVKRKPREDKQMDLFTQDSYEYRVILTNNFCLSAVQVALFYNHRGNMERQFDILKNDFGWNKMPFSSMASNTVFLYFTAICRNLYSKIIAYFAKRIKFLKPTDRLKKFLFRFIILPAKWNKRSRQNQLRIYGQLNYST